jgi:aspartate oxidase
MPKKRLASWSLVLLATVVFTQSVAAQSTQSPLVVSATDQATRDSDRLRILQDELAQEMRAVEEQTKRKAERLAVNDARGVGESESALARHAQNIQALRREIEQATQRLSVGPSARGSPVSVTATRRASPAVAVSSQTATPWWDVYGRAPRRAELAGVRSDEAAVAGAAVAAPAR